jgi:Neuraminidase (sialidase)
MRGWLGLVAIAGIAVTAGADEGRTETFRTVIAPCVGANLRNTEAAVVKRNDGSLLLSWTEFYSSNGADEGPARLVGRISNDGGYSWGDKYTLIENDGKCNVMEVNFLRLKNNALSLFYCQKNTPETDCRVMMRVSPDDGKTWSAAKQISPDAKYTGLTNSRSLRLKSGRIFLEAWEGGDSYAYLSDDEGATWRESQRVNPKSGCYEPVAVELKDGRVLMLIRTALGSQYKSLSTDGGEHWSDPVATQLTGKPAPAALARVPKTGDILAVWSHNADTNARRPLTAAISKDEGETWTQFHDLESGNDAEWAYPSITWDGDRALITYYEAKSGLALVLRILPQAWFYR